MTKSLFFSKCNNCTALLLSSHTSCLFCSRLLRPEINGGKTTSCKPLFCHRSFALPMHLPIAATILVFVSFLFYLTGRASARSSSRAATSCCASATRAWVTLYIPISLVIYLPPFFVFLFFFIIRFPPWCVEQIFYGQRLILVYWGRLYWAGMASTPLSPSSTLHSIYSFPFRTDSYDLARGLVLAHSFFFPTLSSFRFVCASVRLCGHSIFWA